MAPAPATPLTGVRWNTVIASSSSLLSGVLNAAMLVISARHGQTAEIAAYTVMTAALAWVSIIVVGGSSILYVTGDESQRRAVRSQRLLIAVPVMVTAAAAVAAVYSTRGYHLSALVIASVVAVGNNLAELQFGDLARQMRFLASAAAMAATRLLALTLLLAGVPLTAALAVGAVAQLAAGEVLIRRGGAGRPLLWGDLSVSSAVAAFRMNRQLLAYSLAEVFTARAGSIALSIVATPRVLGYYGALTSVYQAFVAVLYGGLRVPMAVRTRRRHGLGPRVAAGRDSEVMIVGAASVVAVGGVLWAPWVVTDLLRLPVAESVTWLRLFAIALPFLTISRAVSLNRLGEGDYRGATRVAVLIATLTAVALVGLLPPLGPLGAAGATACAEALAVAIVGVLALARGPRPASRSLMDGSGHDARTSTSERRRVPR